MRSSILLAAPFVAAAFAQSSEDATNGTVVAISSDSTTVSSTVPYTNGFTSYLTQTNSLGVVTGQPAVATEQSELPVGVSTQPDAVTTQPAVATIPAGLPSGVTYVVQNISASLTSFQVSVGSSTTVVLNSPTGVSITTGSSGSAQTTSGSSSSGSDSDSSDSSDANDSDSDSSSGTSDEDASGTSADSSSTPSADSGASSIKYASAGILSFGALFFALL